MFQDFKCTLVPTYLQGHMGTAWVDDLENPTIAQVVVGFFVFYAGDPNSEVAEELLYNLPEHILVIVNTDDWKKRIETIHKSRDDGIEIEIGTRPEYRRKGLATIVASALIIDCLDRGIYPSWDVANTESVALAQKLGYIMEEPYDTYYINYKK